VKILLQNVEGQDFGPGYRGEQNRGGGKEGAGLNNKQDPQCSGTTGFQRNATKGGDERVTLGSV